MESVGLITNKGYCNAKASRKLGIEYSVLRRWKKQIADDPQTAAPDKERLKAPDEELRRLQSELERVKEERDILKKSLKINDICYFFEESFATTFSLCS